VICEKRDGLLIPPSVREIERRYKGKLQEDLTFGKSMSFGLNLDGSGKYGWFPFRQAFSRKFLDKLFSLKEMSDSKIILDPFMGSGNSLLASVEKGLTAIGVDVSPLFQFVSWVKTKEIPESAFAQAASIIQKASKIDKKSVEMPSLSSFNRLFKRDTIINLLKVIKAAQDQGIAGEIVKFAVVSELLSFSSAARWGKGLRIVRPKPVYDISILLMKITEMLRDMNSDKTENRGKTIPLCGNVNDLEHLKDIDGAHFELNEETGVNRIVTSPPYCNSSDYIEMYKLEHWILGHVQDAKEFQSLSHSTMRSHLTFHDEDLDWKHPVVEDCAAQLESQDLWNKRIPMMVRGYTSDLHQALRNISGIVEEKGRLFILQGNSCYGSIPIPFDLVLADFISEAGLTVEKIVVTRYLSTSSQQRKSLSGRERKILRESLLFANAP
jgi:hypothetical protein